jgi:hypothetical protein
MYIEHRAVGEVLVLIKDDFVSILQETLQEQWDQCKEAMKMFPYFSAWSDVALEECSSLSKIDRYELDQTILGNTIQAGFQTNCGPSSAQWFTYKFYDLERLEPG